MKISTQLKSLRANSNLSAADCAKSIGVSQSTYRDWENGRAISGEPYIKIAALFNVSISELFGSKEEDFTVQLRDILSVLDNLTAHIRSIRSQL